MVCCKSILMIIYRKIYQLTHLKTPLFDHILIQTNNQCTRKCSFCWYGMKDINIPDDVMSEDLFRKIIDELAEMDYSGRVSLFEMNEPLTDPRIFAWVKYVKQKLPNSWQMLATNSDLLTGESAVRLIDGGIDYLNVSSYSDNDYDKAELLMRRLPKRISDRIVNSRLTIEQMIDNRGGNLPHIQKVQAPLKEPCSRVNHILYIKPNGNVVLCFGDYLDLNLLGNIKEQGLREIWFGEKFQTLRKHLNRSDRTVSELCRRCNIGKGAYFVTQARQEQELRKYRLRKKQ